MASITFSFPSLRLKDKFVTRGFCFFLLKLYTYIIIWWRDKIPNYFTREVLEFAASMLSNSVKKD